MTQALDIGLDGEQAVVRWLHLSDFHFQGLERWERRATLQALLRHAAELKERELAPDLVFVTGDIAWSGKRNEYEQAELFFTKLARTLELKPTESFFIVPGNHDVDRKAIGPFDDSILGSLDSQESIEKALRNKPTMELLGRRLEEFYAFTERLLGPARGWRVERPWRFDECEVRGLRVGVLQLNSAWASGSHAEKRLLIGEAQVRDALAETADAVLRIVLVHHPIADLHDVDRERLEGLLAAPGGAHFLLRGHLHRTDTMVSHHPDGVLPMLAAGATYTGGGYPKTHLLTVTDLAAGRAQVHFFQYASRGRGFWRPDNTAYEKARDGIWTFELPPDLKLGSDVAAPPAGEVSETRRATLTARYRAAAAAVHGTVRFVGFADHSPRPNVKVPELFVPLRLSVSRHVDKKESWETRDLLRKLLDVPGNGPAARVVVLGDPGSGKTTFCRFATVLIANETAYENLEAKSELMPLFLPFRDYVRICVECGDCSLLEFLADQAQQQLHVALPGAFLEAALDDGRAVLLLDGLDEVGPAAQREEMCERVKAFCLHYPRVPALVTSRIVGYKEASLPSYGRDGFTHLYFTPFNKDELKEFVSLWYAVQEPDDPITRDLGIDNLMEAIGENSQILELARNPMLATLIALVHRYEARLPGERTALYDICVKTLLETWPASRRRRFREIDERLQRAYLEALAFRMQSAREEPDSEVMISRSELIDTLVEIVRARERSAMAHQQTRGLIERWVRFIEEGTGLLVEQRSGYFTFFHLSLMEYLAARGLELAIRESLEEAIVNRFSNPLWREVCLLIVGSRATDKVFLDRLFYRIREEEPHGEARLERWPFLLRCLKEEAAFDDEQRADIVRGAARQLLLLPYTQWQGCQKILNEIEQFSIRHGTWVGDWLNNEISSATGEALQAIVAIRYRQPDKVRDVLRRRADGPDAAAAILNFWPGGLIGSWAAAVVEPRAAINWVQHHAQEALIVLRSVAAVVSGSATLSSVLLLGLSHSAARFASVARAWIRSLADRRRPGGRGLPFAALTEPPLSLAVTKPAWPWPVSPPAGINRHIDHNAYSRFDLILDFVQNFLVEFSWYSDLHYEWDFYLYFAAEIAQYSRSHHYQGFARYFDHANIQESIRDFAHFFADEFTQCVNPFYFQSAARYLALNVNLNYASSNNRDVHYLLSQKNGSGRTNVRPLPPDSDHLAGVTATRQRAIGSGLDDDVSAYAKSISVRQMAEMWLALVTSIGRMKEERLAYVQRRSENAWLLNTWPAVDARLDETPSPDVLALYFALGWTQATTTWQWPATERWIALLGGAPPSHWLPRSQWHLCWLLHDPDDAGHRQALDDALREGLADDERPQIAAHLRSLFPEQNRV